MQIRSCGEHAIILSVSYDTTREAVREIRKICGYLRSHPHPAIESIRPGLDCVMIECSSHDVEKWLRQLRPTDFENEDPGITKRRVEVPVCYELGHDLQEVAAATGLSGVDIIRIHSAGVYEVWMIGFMPGYPYLGELPKLLQIPRKKTPAISVPAGSVAIAEEYVGIYPLQSPGGWHIIGRTPLRILDYQREPPWVLDYGMEVQFNPISVIEYERMKDEAARN